MKIGMDWFIGLGRNETDDRRSLLQNKSGDEALVHLKFLIKRRLDVNPSSAVYDKPGWEGFLAHRQGEEQLGAYVLSLLAFVKDKN